jgi:hypothetical protein
MTSITWEPVTPEDVYRILSDCDISTDSHEGSTWVRRVIGSVREAAAERAAGNDGRDWPDMIHEVADSAVPIYTYDIWEVFVGVRAYQWSAEVAQAFGDLSNDMEKAATIVLYYMAEQIAYAEVRHQGWED